MYDAAYLELAQRRSLPLATLDQELRAAAPALNIALLAPPERSNRDGRRPTSDRRDQKWMARL
jgi:hypothetical protein